VDAAIAKSERAQRDVGATRGRVPNGPLRHYTQFDVSMAIADMPRYRAFTAR